MVTMLQELGIFCIGVDNAERTYIDLKLNHSLFCDCSDDLVIESVLKHGITHIFHFAASAAIADSVEYQETRPCNPYGRSKLMCEEAIQEICTSAGIDTVIFRYFNVAGAYNDAGDHLDSDHILPKICSAIYDYNYFTINGGNYKTRDGTCVRDYVHVLDICRAHIHACDFLGDLPDMKGVYTFNLGSREGFTNKEIVEAFQKYTGEELKYVIGDRRPGDPPLLIAENSKFIEQTGFEYKHTDLEKIVTSAWDWYKKCKMRNEK